jgi:two-component system response regulator YesN
LYTVAVVDDEPWNLKGFMRLTDWSSRGFSIAYSGSKSTEALDHLKKNRVDVLFADIKMPKVSGLELIRGINAKERGIICVIISGYAEFEYAQAALKEGVYDYCLKPLNSSKLDEMLLKIKLELDEAALKQQSIPEFTELDYEKLCAILDRQPGPKRKFIQGVLCDSGVGTAIASMEGIRSAFCRAGRNMRLCLANTDSSMASLIKNDHGGASGLSNLWAFDESLDPQALHREASCARAEFFIRQSPGVYSYSKGNQAEASKALDAVTASLKAKDEAGIAKWFNEFPGFCAENGLSIQDVEIVWNQIVWCVTHFFPDRSSEMEYMDFSQMVSLYPSLGMFCQQMGVQAQALAKAAQEVVSLKAQPSDSLVGKVNLYIEDHFNEDISLKSIAPLFYVNPNYLCSQFAKQNGMTFTAYINSLRITKSKALLLETGRTINDIAQATGFNDYFYFNKVFKKLTGTTPAKFRRGSDE